MDILNNKINIMLTLWSTILSSILAFIKIKETIDKRTKIEISYNFSSNSYIGNYILIRNLSQHPITLKYWELTIYQKYYYFFKKLKTKKTPDYDYQKTLDPHSKIELEFKDLEYFKFNKNTSVYIYIYLAGKSKPIIKKVY